MNNLKKNLMRKNYISALKKINISQKQYFYQCSLLPSHHSGRYVLPCRHREIAIVAQNCGTRYMHKNSGDWLSYTEKWFSFLLPRMAHFRGKFRNKD